MKMPTTCKDFTGVRFGRLTAIRWVSSRPTRWLCRCDCGNEKAINVEVLKKGKAQSCGCLRSEVLAKLRHRHGFCASRSEGERNPKRIYSVWCAMLRRCNNPHCRDYPNYGGRGIKVCDRWMEFTNFLADMGETEKGLTLDRIEVDGNYEPGNCRWVSRKDQCRNMRRNRHLTAFGKTMLRVDWETNLNLKKSFVDGWSESKETFEDFLLRNGHGHQA